MMNVSPKEVDAYLREAKPNVHGLKEPFYVKFLAQGEYNMNFLIQTLEKKFVFRVNVGGSQLQLKNQITYEYQALLALLPSKRTPRPYFVDDSKSILPYGLLIMEYLPGRPLDYQRDLLKAADIFAAIHQTDISADRHFLWEKKLFSARVEESARLLAPFLQNEEMPLETKELLQFFFNWCVKHQNGESYFEKQQWWVINNTEVNSHNFIIGPEKSWLVDWEKPVISHPCQDLTQFMVKTTTSWRSEIVLSAAEKNTFLTAYCTKVGRDAAEVAESIRLYEPYMYLRALSWCAMALAAYQTKPLKNEAIYQKIRQFLAPQYIQEIMKECGVEK